MQFTLKRSLATVASVIALFVVILAGNAGVGTAFSGHHTLGSHSSDQKQLAWYCPAPPMAC